MNNNGVEVYIHIPFCERKCRYCDFLSFPGTEREQRRYMDALQQEIRRIRCDLPVRSVFFGGGTPSVLPAQWIVETLDLLRKQFSFAEGAEITIEANPGTVTPDKLQTYRIAGINRLSLGAQSFCDKELRLLGRIHTAEEIRESVRYARQAGFTNLNLDLISALPGQTEADWAYTLQQAVACRPEHISAYSLILEEGTPLAKACAEGNPEVPPLPDEETERRIYARTNALLAGAGYTQYEISNYARPGYACLHNTGYWTGVPYFGFGLGAASYLPAALAPDGWEQGEEKGSRQAGGPEHQGEDAPWVRYTNTGAMPAYLNGTGKPADLQILHRRDREAEFMILGLRMTEGIEEEEFRTRFGHPADAVFGDVLRKFEQSGHLQREEGRIRFTAIGVSVSNAILVDFL